MELLGRLNKEKTVFALALALLGFTGYRVADNLLMDRSLPSDPRADRGDLREADPKLTEEIEPVAYPRFANFGARNPFQLPKPNVRAEGYFVVSESRGRPHVKCEYRFSPDGPLDRVRIEFPKQWTMTPTSEDVIIADVRSEGGTRIAALSFDEIKDGPFMVALTFTPERHTSSSQVEFPLIRTIETASELGYIGVCSSRYYNVVAKPGEGLERAARPPRQLGKVDAAFKYERHPYKLVLSFQRRADVAVKPPKPKPPAPKPPKPKPKPPAPKPPKPPKPPEPPKPPKPPDDGGEVVAEQPFEVPFTFNATITVGKKYAVLQDKATGTLTRCTIGDSLNGLTIVEIHSSSVVVRDEQGNQYELVDSVREKYD